jgi:Mg2+ and Co2+ transporters
MESFIVYPHGIKRSDPLTVGTSLPSDNFRLLILSDQELDQIPRLISLETNIQMDLLTLSPLNYPQVKRLGPTVYLVSYRDLDSKGEELTIRFLLTATDFIMIGWNGVTIEKIMVWAQSGILGNPFNLAQVLGSRVLRHHLNRLEQFEDLIDSLEEEVMTEPRSAHQVRIGILHKQVVGLKRSLNLNLYVFNRLANIVSSDTSAIWQELVQDTERELENARQTHELVESLREAYQAAIDNRSNEIMKWLTLLATILLPINILTSFFGMNFANMPIIHLNHGIIVFYIACIVIVTAAIFLFWRKKWLRK